MDQELFHHPHAITATGLQLSWVRALFIVGKALAEKYPNEDDWLEFLDSDEFKFAVEDFSQYIADINDAVDVPNASPTDVAEAVSQHFLRAREAVEELAEKLDVKPEELMSIFVRVVL
jgi:hypothetical protein